MATMIMDDGLNIQIVVKAHDRRFVVLDLEGRAGVEPVVAPDLGLHAGNDFMIRVLLDPDLVEFRRLQPRQVKNVTPDLSKLRLAYLFWRWGYREFGRERGKPRGPAIIVLVPILLAVPPPAPISILI